VWKRSNPSGRKGGGIQKEPLEECHGHRSSDRATHLASRGLRDPSQEETRQKTSRLLPLPLDQVRLPWRSSRVGSGWGNQVHVSRGGCQVLGCADGPLQTDLAAGTAATRRFPRGGGQTCRRGTGFAGDIRQNKSSRRGLPQRFGGLPGAVGRRDLQVFLESRTLLPENAQGGAALCQV